MLRTKTLLWLIPATVVAMVAVANGAMRMRGTRHAAAPTHAACAHELAIDVDGDGTTETVRLVRVGDDAWADVWAGASMRSTTRVGAWRDGAALEAIDVNGDGRVDLVRRWREGAEKHAQVWLSDGSAFDEGWSGLSDDTCFAQR